MNAVHAEIQAALKADDKRLAAAGYDRSPPNCKNCDHATLNVPKRKLESGFTIAPYDIKRTKPKRWCRKHQAFVENKAVCENWRHGDEVLA